MIPHPFGTTVYYVHLIQHGEGCDYTIGCGHRLRSLKAKTYPEAHAEVDALLKEEHTSEEREVEHVRILEVTNMHEVDVKAWYAGLGMQRKAEELKAQEARERAELERLQKKYTP